jgi:hypothetical protein
MLLTLTEVNEIVSAEALEDAPSSSPSSKTQATSSLRVIMSYSSLLSSRGSGDQFSRTLGELIARGESSFAKVILVAETW